MQEGGSLEWMNDVVALSTMAKGAALYSPRDQTLCSYHAKARDRYTRTGRFLWGLDRYG